MTFNPFNPSTTARRAAAALLLSAALALTGVAPAHAWGFGQPTAGAHERTQPAGGFFRFLLKLLGFTGVTTDTTSPPRDSNGTMDPNGVQ